MGTETEKREMKEETERKMEGGKESKGKEDETGRQENKTNTMTLTSKTPHGRRHTHTDRTKDEYNQNVYTEHLEQTKPPRGARRVLTSPTLSERLSGASATGCQTAAMVLQCLKAGWFKFVPFLPSIPKILEALKTSSLTWLQHIFVFVLVLLLSNIQILITNSENHWELEMKQKLSHA